MSSRTRSSRVVFLTFMLGILNLCLGYALGVYLGYGPPGLAATWEAIGGGPSAGRPIGGAKGPSRGPGQDFGASSPDDMLSDEADDDWSDEFDSLDPYEDLDDGLGGLLNPDTPELWDLEEKYVETSILKLNIAMMKSGQKATELDSRLRACQGRTDPETIRKCLEGLKEDCRIYLAEQAEQSEKFRQRIGELGQLSALGEEIELANLEQAAQIETTLSNLEYMDFEEDLEESNSRLLAELGNLRLARHHLRDEQEAAFLTIARCENRMDKIEKQLHHDPLSDLPNRIGLEVVLWQWWREGRHRSEQINAALFDLDHFGRLNEQRGPLAGDRILRRLAKLIRSLASGEDLVGRWAGQRFLMMMLDVGPRAAVKNAELVRQSIERVTFNHGEHAIRVTASCGITEVTPEDRYETVLQRLDEALSQAKQAGGNQSFFSDGSELEPIESPNLGAKYSDIPI